ncbi:hypothetical protein A7976_07680 [Methylobacillus sp. MM3]|nr:hypothetical protein A7976_07680 [Methylobacillus sp. MM3]
MGTISLSGNIMMNRLFSIAKPALAILAALLVAGCGGGRGISDSKGTLAVIEIAKKSPTSVGDCPVKVTISNRMNIGWDGVSYHLAMHNRKGVSVGRLMGSPRKKTPAGEDLMDTGSVLGVKCEDITGLALVYFGYYPTGKKEAHAHVKSVRVILK